MSTAALASVAVIATVGMAGVIVGLACLMVDAGIAAFRFIRGTL